MPIAESGRCERCSANRIIKAGICKRCRNVSFEQIPVASVEA